MLITNVEYKRLMQMKKYFIPNYPELPLENQNAFYN